MQQREVPARTHEPLLGTPSFGERGVPALPQDAQDAGDVPRLGVLVQPLLRDGVAEAFALAPVDDKSPYDTGELAPVFEPKEPIIARVLMGEPSAERPAG